MPLTFDDLVPASKVAFDDLIPKSRVSFDDLVPAHPVVAPSTPEEVAQRLGIGGAEQLQPEPLIEGAPTEETPLVKFPQGAKKFLGEAIARGTLGPIAAALIPEKEKTGVGESILGMAEGMTTPSGLASIPAFMAAPQLLVPEMALHAAKQAGEEFQQGEIGKGMTTFALGAAPLVHSIVPLKSPIGRREPPPLPEAKPPSLPTSIPETAKVLQESGLIKTETVQPKEPYAIQEQSPDANVLQQERQQVGLQRMGEENAQPEVPAGTQAQAEVAPQPLKWTTATEPLSAMIVREAKSMIPPEESIGVAPPGSSAIQRAITTIKEIKSASLEIPKMDDLKRSILDWSAKLQRSFGEIKEAQKAIESVAKKPLEREAITNWIEAAGDDAVLAAREVASGDPKLQKGYAAARSLTSEQLKIANDVKTAFDTLFKRGEYYGIIDSFRENYTPHIWNLGGTISRLTRSSRILSDAFRFSKARTFASFFEGESVGFKPKTKDIAKLLPVYLHEMNNAIAAKQLVENLSKGVASDGRPLLAPRGIGKQVERDAGKATLILPSIPKELGTGDYKILNQPALTDWRWMSKDDAGNPIFMKSDLAVHPEAAPYIKRMLGQSEIRNWYSTPTTTLAEIPKLIVKGLDAAQSEAKRSMLGFLSTFHQIQEGTHAIGHRVNPFIDIPTIDLMRNPKQMDAARHGLMLNPDRISERVFMEGLGETGLISKLPIVGKLADKYASYLFHDYIPGLKYKTYEDILARNTHLYSKELVAGKVALEDVKLLSSEQTNAAYGHLNYAELGRDPTIQHLMQLTLLAPDFLEARGRFAAQAAKTLLGGRSGVEQLMALSFLAAVQFGAAKISNKLMDDNWHFDHPFEIVVGNRRYAMRSVPEDIYNLIKDTRQFIYGRINPTIAKGAIQGVTGVNYRGEKVTFMETLGELLATYIPITVRWLPGLKNLTRTSQNRPVSPLEEFAGTMGIRISRYSPVTEIYKLASEWNEKRGLPKDRGTYPISKYQQLRYALEDGDLERAAMERDKLVESGMSLSAIAKGFRESIHHPFTGSNATDAEFRKTLNEHDQLLYDAAIAKRKEIMIKFNALR